MNGEAFQLSVRLVWLPNARNASNFDLTIPHHKRLVIRQISGFAHMPAGVALTCISITTSVGPSDIGSNLGEINVAPKFVGTEDGPTDVPQLYVFNDNVTAFAQGPNPAQILASRTPEAVPQNQPQGEVFMTVFGYLVDLH